MKKIKNSFSGIFVGIIFVIIGVCVLWWNEGNNVKNLKTIKEAKGNLVQVESNKVDSKNNGKLIAVTGDVIIGDEFLSDDQFKVSISNTVKMQRVVEMYQWEEESETKDDKTVYNYKKVWSKKIINSSNFKLSSHENPNEFPYDSETKISSNVKIGEYSLTNNIVELFNTKSRYDLTDCNINNTCVLPNYNYFVKDNYITTTRDINNPEIGDIRIYYVYNNDKTVSVLGKQNGNSIDEYLSNVNKTVSRVESGSVSGEQMITNIENDNNTMKWVFRFVGTFLVVIGFIAFLNPIITITSFIPLLGGGISGLISLAGGAMGLALSFVVIAIAWIRFRPLVGICLLVFVVCLVALAVSIFVKLKKKNNQQVIQQPQVQQM